MKCVTITDAELAELRARLSAAEQERDTLDDNAKEFFDRWQAAEARAEVTEQALQRARRRVGYWLGQCFWWRRQCEEMYDEADLNWFADNADEYFDKWLAADAQIAAALKALDDTSQFCTERVDVARAALTRSGGDEA